MYILIAVVTIGIGLCMYWYGTVFIYPSSCGVTLWESVSADCRGEVVWVSLYAVGQANSVLINQDVLNRVS